MIRGNTNDFVVHPLPKDSTSAHGAPTTLDPRLPVHLDPAQQF